MTLHRIFSTAAIAAAVLFFAAPVRADLIINGGFETATALAHKDQFQTVNPTGWTCAQCGQNGRIYTYVDGPGQATSGDGGYAVYAGGPATSPVGGNFVQADGDTGYQASFSQTVNGLTIGVNYLLTFWQAAGQQTTFTGATTERWQVNFGTSATQYSTLMTNPTGGFQAWNLVSMVFTANATSQVLTFLAQGTPNNLPPTVFLDGVSMVAAPEPSSLAVLAVATVGLGALGFHRRGTRSDAI